MARHMTRNSGVRIGPITILVFVITLCIAVLATLAVTTARANSASTQRQIAFTNDVYVNETAAQTMLSLVDAAVISGTSSVEAALPAIKAAAAATDDVRATIEVEGDLLKATFETSSGRQLLVEVRLGEGTYRIEKWKTATNWKEDNTQQLWAG